MLQVGNQNKELIKVWENTDMEKVDVNPNSSYELTRNRGVLQGNVRSDIWLAYSLFSTTICV